MVEVFRRTTQRLNGTTKRGWKRRTRKQSPDWACSIRSVKCRTVARHFCRFTPLPHPVQVGQGVKKNEKKAFELFKMAADMEDSEGHLRLAHQYYDGLGTPRDYRKAIRSVNALCKVAHKPAPLTTLQIDTTHLRLNKDMFSPCTRSV